MSSPSRLTLLVAVVAVATGASGCLSQSLVPTVSPTEIDVFARVIVVNEEAEMHGVNVQTRVGDEVVDSSSDSVEANVTETVEVGVPARGDVQFRVTATNGGRADVTLAVASCELLELNFALRDGTVQTLEIRC